jgi:hypothetical protein
MTTPADLALSILGSLAGGAVTVLAVTWRIAGKVAGWTHDLASLKKTLEDHVEEDEKCLKDQHKSLTEITRSLGRLEGATWEEQTNPDNPRHGRR